MTTNRYAVVRTSDQAVVNIVQWDGDTDKWCPPEGCTARVATTADRIAAVVSTEERNRRTIEDAARAALAANRDYLANAPDTSAARDKQIKALTRQQNGVIRLLLGALEGTD